MLQTFIHFRPIALSIRHSRCSSTRERHPAWQASIVPAYSIMGRAFHAASFFESMAACQQPFTRTNTETMRRQASPVR